MTPAIRRADGPQPRPDEPQRRLCSWCLKPTTAPSGIRETDSVLCPSCMRSPRREGR
jgi:hypothetical protein